MIDEIGRRELLVALTGWIGGCLGAQYASQDPPESSGMLPGVDPGMTEDISENVRIFRTDEEIDGIRNELDNLPAIVIAIDGPDAGSMAWIGE